MFLSSRVVPATPPSFVKLNFIVSAVITGRGTSTPRSDQVPELEVTPSRAPAADASRLLDEPPPARPRPRWRCRAWRAQSHRSRRVIPTPPQRDGRSCPSVVPASISSGSIARGRPSAVQSSSDHAPLRASSNCVVDAFVRSQTRRPVKSHPNKSGIRSSDSLTSSSGDRDVASARSW